MNAMLDLARRRYTAKHYDPAKPLTDAELRELLEIMRLAPSSINIQPWHFHVVRSPEARARLLPAILDFNVKRVEDASVILVISVETALVKRVAAVTDRERADGRFDAEARATGFDLEVEAVRKNAVARYCSGPDRGLGWAREQAHIALGFLLYAAAGMGIDATAMGGMDFERVDGILGLRAEGRRAVIGCALGHRSEDDGNARRPKSRLPLEELVTVL